MRRKLAFVVALALAFSCCATIALGASGITPYASPTISAKGAVMKAGSKTGELRISYEVDAEGRASELGVSSIKIYKSDGSYVTTITGTTDNGLISSGSVHAGTYSYIGTSGQHYFAKVTVFATIGSVSDSKTITTGTVQAP